MKNQKRNFKSGLLCLLLFILSIIPSFSQSGSITPATPWANSQTVNFGTGTEFTIAMGGGSAMASKRTCGAATAVMVPNIDASNTEYMQGSVPAAGGATISRITFSVSGNSTGTTVYTNQVFYSTDAVFNVSNVLGYFDFTYTGYDQACTPQTINFPAGVKSFRIYRAGKFTAGTPYIVETGTATGGTQTMNFDNMSVWVNSGTPQPTLSVTPTSRTGFTYVLGAGPSGNQSFAVSGTSLTAGVPVVITAGADYEVSTAAGGPYAATATIANAAGGTLAATNIYIRLKAGRAVGLYNGQLTSISGGGDGTALTVSASGSVTSGVLTPLAAPSVAAGATAIGSTSATARWTAVANASGGYIVQVFQGATLINTYNVAGQATTSVVMTGLTGSTAYTYKVTAVGDGLTYSNSPASSSSAVFNTTVGTPTFCELPLYNTDFKDWSTLNYSSSSSNPFLLNFGAGAGFTVTEDASVDNTIGKYWIEGSASGRNFITKAFNIIPGSAAAYVEIDFELQNDGSNRVFSLNNQTATQVSILSVNLTGGAYDLVNLKANLTSFGTGTTLTGGLVGTWIAGSTVQLPKSAIGRITVGFYVPGISGNQTFDIMTLRTLMPLRGIKVCNSVGALKYVASTSYSNCASDPTGLTITGVKGSTTKVTGIVNVKGWNITGPMTFAITGTNAGQFTLPVTSITQASGLAGQSITVEFMPSVLSGVSNAQLMISSTGAPSYCVSLTGLTSTSAAPEITTPVQTWNFPTSLIAPTTQNITISGANLTGPVTLTLGGADAAQFSLASNTVTLAQALAGTPIEVTYLGGISSPLTQNATLTLSSPGAPNVVLPLVGLTYNLPPTLYSLTKNVTPAGTGFITQDLGGSLFAAGTTVSVTAIPQTGYKFKRWTDNGSTALVRSILMISNMNITAEFEIGTGPSASPFNAYTPLVVGNTSFTARWGAAPASTSYVVKVYNNVGTLVYTSPAQGGAVRSLNITGLTAGTQYTYTVTASTGDVSNIVGPVLTTGGSVPACGTVG